MTTDRTYRRTRVIVSKFQTTLLLTNAIIILVSFGVAFVQLYRHFLRLYDLGVDPTSLQTESYNIFLQMILACVGCLLWSTLVTVVLSHRISGPVVRLQNFFTDIKGGVRPVPKLTFRDKDFFSALPDTINDALETLKQDST